MAGPGPGPERAPPPPRRSPFGADEPDDVRVRGAIVRVDGARRAEAEAIGRDGSIEMLSIGPDIWLAVSDRAPDEVRAAVGAVAARAACADLTHARVVLRVEGPDARSRLARGCPMDLDTVEPGGAAATMLAHFEVVIRRGREPDAFEVFVSRSVARSAREWLRGPGADASAAPAR